MGIDKHLILTMERSSARQHTMRGGCAAMQTPPEKILFFNGYDCLDFNSDSRVIANLAERDGFPFVHQFAKDVESAFVNQSPAGAAQTWNLGRILRHIARGKETCLVTLDDRILTLPFPFVDKITTELQNREEEFYFWQLRVRMGDAYNLLSDFTRVCTYYPELVDNVDEYIELMDRDVSVFHDTLSEKVILDSQKFLDDHYEKTEMTIEAPAYVEKYLQKTIIGYDETLILSPVGAAWLLCQALDMEELDPSDDENKEHYWETFNHRRNTLDSWICFDLEEFAGEAISDGKGIYCPKRMEYNYIHDWLPMGSSVEWANPNNIRAEKLRNLSAPFNFIEIE